MTLLQLDVPFEADVADERHGHDAAAVVGRGDRAGVRRRHEREALDADRAGQVIDGGVVSLTVIVCVQVFELPHESVAW